VQGAAVYDSIGKQSRPADMSDADWNSKITGEQSSARSAYDFLETSAYNAIASEQDPNKRMAEIEKFTPVFPKSKFEAQMSQLALYSLRQLNQPQRLVAYGEKALAANPNSLPTLLMMADAYASDPKEAAKAATYANKVLTLAGPNPEAGDKEKRSYESGGCSFAGRPPRPAAGALLPGIRLRQAEQEGGRRGGTAEGGCYRGTLSGAGQRDAD